MCDNCTKDKLIPIVRGLRTRFIFIHCNKCNSYYELMFLYDKSDSIKGNDTYLFTIGSVSYGEAFIHYLKCSKKDVLENMLEDEIKYRIIEI